MFVVSERKQGAPVGTVISERKQRTSWKIPPPPPASVVNNGFGKKILEKFGWNPGEGLGAQKQGMKKHITTKIKNNNQGIGYKSNGEEWLKQQNDFSELLANLSGESTEVKENEVSESNGKNSLEMRSKQSRARVHYQKFTRGKDLSRYSSKDLAQILGPATVNGSALKKSLEDNVNPLNVNHINRGSMKDYFQKKDVLWPVINKANSENTQPVESESKGESLLSGSNNDNESGIQRSEKKNKNNCDTESSAEIDNSTSEGITSSVCDKQQFRKKMKKKEKSLSTFIVDINEENIDNDSNRTLELNESNSGSVEATVESNVCDKKRKNKNKKKSKKRKQHETNENENNCVDTGNNDYSEDVENGFSISSPKKKKKRKEKRME